MWTRPARYKGVPVSPSKWTKRINLPVISPPLKPKPHASVFDKLVHGLSTRAPTFAVVEQGEKSVTVPFSVTGLDIGNEVGIRGAFFGWKEEPVQMQCMMDGDTVVHKVEVELEPGIYEYQFVVRDPESGEFHPRVFDTNYTTTTEENYTNNVIVVVINTDFILAPGRLAATSKE